MGIFKRKDAIKEAIRKAKLWTFTYKTHLLKGAIAVGFLTIVTISGNSYVQANTYEVFHVFVGDKEVGVVDDRQSVENFLAQKYNQIQAANPGIHMELKVDPVRFVSERAFKAKSDTEAALANLDRLIRPQATGVQIIVNNKVVAIVKDKETANHILETLKNRYIPAKNSMTVSTLAANSPQESTPVLKSVAFTQTVDLKQVDINPGELSEPQDVLRKLETGGVAPMKYTVQKGDCISCIAAKFDIDTQVIYDRNPWIVDDMIRPGDVLDITVYQPTLSVKTTETYTEQEEIQYVTNYKLDPTIRNGKVIIKSPGKNGLKEVTYLVTKINGQMIKEDLVGEKVLREPVPAFAIKGTKVIRGEGTGRFAWPIVGARMTSSFGKRWGTVHKGVDLVSSNRNIMAADNGKVIFAGARSSYGNLIIIDHLNGYQTYYAHLSKISVKTGEIVEKGDKIGVMGATGDATGVHLHFEVHVDGTAENPLKFLHW
ncbi:MAG TPA: M23 family metallopeptidase [Bacilli bacterium]